MTDTNRDDFMPQWGPAGSTGGTAAVPQAVGRVQLAAIESPAGLAGGTFATAHTNNVVVLSPQWSPTGSAGGTPEST